MSLLYNPKQDIKFVGLFLICWSTFLFLFNIRLRLVYGYQQHHPSTTFFFLFFSFFWQKYYYIYFKKNLQSVLLFHHLRSYKFFTILSIMSFLITILRNNCFSLENRHNKFETNAYRTIFEVILVQCFIWNSY